MILPGQIQGDLVWSDGSYHCVAGSVVDLISTMAKSPNLPKDVKDWIGDTFWEANEKLKEQAGSLVDERDRLEAETVSLKADIQRHINQIFDLQEQIVGFKAENGSLRNAKLEKQIAALQDELKGCREQVACLVDEQDQLKQQIARLKIANESLTGQVTVQIQENEKLEARIQQKDNDRDQLEQQIKTLRTEWSRDVTTRNRCISEMEQLIRECREKAEKAETEKATLEGLLKEANELYVDRQEDVLRLQQLTQELKTENAERQDKIDCLTIDKQDLTAQIQGQQQTIQALKDQVANFQDDAIDADTTIRSLEIKISEANKQILSLETDNLALRVDRLLR